MIARLWRTEIHPEKEPTYEEFVRSRSRPMFTAMPGCLGAVFLRGSAADQAALTFWDNIQSVDGLSSSELYKRTAGDLERSGCLSGDQSVVVFEVEGEVGGTDSARPGANALANALAKLGALRDEEVLQQRGVQDSNGNRRLVSSGSSFEQQIGYSRAVVDGEWVFVSGTTGFDYATMMIADDVVEQAEQCLRNIAAALDEAGGSVTDVVRVRYFLADAADLERCWPLLRQWFGDVRPAATMV